MEQLKIKQKQLDFLDWEFGVFFHFGIRTFYEGHKDWDMQDMPLSGFKPANLNCEQWIRVSKEAGARYAVLVCKHHDGFANWPSAYTEYSVKNTPWKDGKGDVVREFTDACKKYGLKVGLYYSPAQFGSNSMSSSEYDDYFINQLSELLTNYGKIDYLWFDGCGSENHQYDTKRIVKAIRDMQPDILLFNMWDPDTRWVGNESGLAHMPNHNIVNELNFSVQTDKKDALDKNAFLPVECDFRMRLRNWFYSDSDEDTVKDLNELLGIYQYSVGRGANMLLNVGPDRDGLIPEKDAARLLELGAEIKRRYGSSLYTVKAPEGAGGRYEIKLPNHTVVDTVILKENITDGEKITSVKVFACPYEYGEPILVGQWCTVGHKLICTFPPVRTEKLIVETESECNDEELTEISVYSTK